jgi:class 3 adenylate cyclase
MPDEPKPLDIPGNQTLAAIAFTEAVNLSTLIAEDEQHTLSILSRDLKLIAEICQDFEGSVLKSTGNGLLIYFVSAVSAVACAIEIQKALAAVAENLPPQDILPHRIGIHLGDVFFCDSEVMGNGVNLAAQLQQVASPGSICISQTVYDVVKNGLALQATYCGLKQLDNIADPVPVYQVLIAEGVAEERVADVRTYLTREEYRDRIILINKVRQYWISGVLETGLRDRALIALGLNEGIDSLKLPWGLTWTNADEAGNPLPPGTKIIDKLPQFGKGGTLLILGEPGGGKTTTLLELASELLLAAEHDYTQPLPIVFNLSSWSIKQSIADWLVQQLHIQYQVSKDIGKHWLQNQQLLLMLDGLDEVSVLYRDACVVALNDFSLKYGQTDMVVTSRLQDYELLSNRLKIKTAVYLQPLSLEQIETYLTNAGGELAAVKQALRQDIILQELARSPLMLSIIALAYQGKSFDDVTQIYSLEERRQHILNAYIERMFHRRSSKQYSKVKAMRWLIWLAKQMREKYQSVFFIELLQNNWLPNIWYKLIAAIIIGIIAGLLCGIGGVLNVGILLLDWELAKLAGINIAIGTGIISAIVFGFIYPRINPVESLKWSVEKARKKLNQGLTVGIVSGAILGPICGAFYSLVLKVGNVWTESLSFGLRIGLGVALIFALLGGLNNPTVENSTIPNQGIWQSAQNAVIFFLLGATGMGLVAFILGLPILVGAITGLLFGVFVAGAAGIKHFALRLVLVCNGSIPGNYARFLDWATEHILLQKVGGGYIFIHRLLLEHLAEMGNR